jgi:hypothetical protein
MNKTIRYFVLAAVTAAGIATVADALPNKTITFRYFTDAAKTDVCGGRTISCHGVSHWGCRTAFSTRTERACH